MNIDCERRFGIPDVIDFCRRNDSRGLCFDGWPDNIMAIYLRFHQQNGSLCLVEDDGVLVGMGVGFQCNEDDLDRHWRPSNPEGDSFYISDIICTTKGAVATCVDELKERTPSWKDLKLFGLRHGHKRQLKPEILERVLCTYQGQ
jgi:hypothetical protein